MTKREEILQDIISNAQRLNIKPGDNKWPSLITRILALHGQPKTKTKEYAQILTTTYKINQWNNNLPQEQPKNQTPPQPQTTKPDEPNYVKETLKKIAFSEPTEIKHLPKQENKQQDQLTDRQTVQILYETARRDTINGVGRILLCEARTITDDKTLRSQDIIQLWQKQYPLIDIEQATNNVLLIYFNGKETTKNERNNNPPMIPPLAKPFKANKDKITNI